MYVLEGSMIMQVAGGEQITLHPGDTFHESPTDVHSVGRNASNTIHTKFVVFFVKNEGAPASRPPLGTGLRLPIVARRLPRESSPHTLQTSLLGPNGVAQTSITDLLVEIQHGNASAYDALLPLVYDELRRVAARSMRRERTAHTLQPTALVHEAYLRLVKQPSLSFENRQHFYAMAATLMRRILVDYARRAHADKRNARNIVSIDDNMDAEQPASDPMEILGVDEAIQQLAALDARQAQIVELRYFAGFTVEETAKFLQISERTVKRDWAIARAFLHRALDHRSSQPQ